MQQLLVQWMRKHCVIIAGKMVQNMVYATLTTFMFYGRTFQSRQNVQYLNNHPIASSTPKVRKFEPHHKKQVLDSLRQTKSQNDLLSYRVSFLMYQNRRYFLQTANSKYADQTVRIGRMICVFVFRMWLKAVFSPDEAHMTSMQVWPAYMH